MLATVTGVNTDRREVLADGLSIPYDYLVIATGATHSYFGKDAWAPFAPGLKRVEDATFVRRRMLEAFEHAEVAASEVERRRLLTFVIVGGGPTGVELAGAVAELTRRALACDFRRIRGQRARVLLVESGPRLLAAFTERLSAYARRALERLGVETMLGRAVERCDSRGVVVAGERIE